MRLRLPEQVRHVQQVAAMLLQNAVQLQIAGDRELVGLAGNGDEVRRQRLDVAQLAGNADEDVFVLVIQTRQSADGIAGVSPDAELGDAANVDGDAHRSV